MGIPAPEFDPVLLREHLYRDLRKDFLVIPSEARQSIFKPISDIGLGLYEYKFGEDDEVTAGLSFFRNMFSRKLGYHLALAAGLLLVYGLIYLLAFRGRRARAFRRRAEKAADIESAPVDETSLKAMSTRAPHTPMPSLSFSPMSSGDFSSLGASPEHVFIKTTTLPSGDDDFSLKTGLSAGSDVVRIY